jgi:chorismate mutase
MKSKPSQKVKRTVNDKTNIAINTELNPELNLIDAQILSLLKKRLDLIKNESKDYVKDTNDSIKAVIVSQEDFLKYSKQFKLTSKFTRRLYRFLSQESIRIQKQVIKNKK